MPQPVAYVRNYDFTDYQADYPSQPLPAAPIDANLDAIGISIGEIIARLAIVQRDDGELSNRIVKPESFSTAALAMIGGYNPRGAWLTATAYAVRDIVTESSATYVCAVAHTSGTFATDLAAGKWILLAGSSGSIALDSLTDVTAPTPASSDLLYWNGSNWVNGKLLTAMITDAQVTFAKMAASSFITSTSLTGASNTNFATSLAVKTYIDSLSSNDTGANVVAASTTNITGAYDYVTVTGNTTIAAFTLAEDEEKWVAFTGTPTITYNAASMINITGANIAVQAGDKALLRGLGSGNTVMVDYVRASGRALAVATPTIPVAQGGTGLTASGTSGNVLTSNGSEWVSSPATRNLVANCNFTGATAGSGGVNFSNNLSKNRTGTGVYDFTFGTVQPDTNYQVFGNGLSSTANKGLFFEVSSKTTTGFTVTVWTVFTATVQDPTTADIAVLRY